MKTFTSDWVAVKGRTRVEAAFSVFGNVDREGDVVEPGSIDDGLHIPISAWNHASWTAGVPPIGRGRIRTTKSEAIVSADLFNTTAAMETAEVLRELGDLARWSFGYGTLLSEPGTVGGLRVNRLTKLLVYEASPVLVPANDSTRTLSMSTPDDDQAALRAIARQFEQDAADRVANEYARFLARQMEVA